MVEHSATLLYPHTFEKGSLASPSFDNVLVHDKLKGTGKLPAIQELPVYNPQWQLMNFSSLNQQESEASKFDSCTIVMQVYSRTSTFLDRLKHYHTLPLLHSIIIVWNNLQVAPPTINHPLSPTVDPTAPSFAVPIHILQQPRNSMNNRFLPFSELKTSCVLAMDDDWDFPHSKLLRAIRTWQTSPTGSARLVGFQQQGRVHIRKPNSDAPKSLLDLHVRGIRPNARLAHTRVLFRWGYGKTTRAAVSILMPSATVYHARYHEMYTKGLPKQAREVVDEVTNCDDILFNMLVANATGMGPVVLSDEARIEKSLVFETVGDGSASQVVRKDGLWRDKEHWEKRLWCINYFVEEVFGGKMPLVSTKILGVKKKRRVELNRSVAEGKEKRKTSVQ
ncbi:glycosyl transferase family 64 domain-containing protein [Chytriomyces sp. MP71]|nr:glycosyl transferase family 64 domain-containing protein [Chytriomyces sp. MP71]